MEIRFLKNTETSTFIESDRRVSSQHFQPDMLAPFSGLILNPPQEITADSLPLKALAYLEFGQVNGGLILDDFQDACDFFTNFNDLELIGYKQVAKNGGIPNSQPLHVRTHILCIERIQNRQLLLSGCPQGVVHSLKQTT